MRIRICKRCGREFERESNSYACMCPECSKQAKKESVLRERTCKICGTTFMGYPRSFFCPSCKEERQRQQKRIYNQRKPARHINSTDICEACGKTYLVKSGMQRYCPECAKTEVPQNISAHKIEYMAANKEKINKIKKETAGRRYVCRVCGKEFEKHSPRVTCSEECEKKLKRINREKARIPADKKRENGVPKSGIPGITWHKSHKKWQVKCKNKYVGIFETVEQAAEELKKYKNNIKN